MTDSEYAKYLFNWLINSGEDCCAKCSHCSMTELCDNHKQNGILDYTVCYNGLKEYAEQHKKLKPGKRRAAGK